jgi:hypothetical protein
LEEIFPALVFSPPIRDYLGYDEIFFEPFKPEWRE